MGQNELSFIDPSIWNKASEVLKKTNSINPFKHKFKKYYPTQLKQAENKLSYYQNCYDYHFANYVFVIIIIINYHQYYLLS